MSDDLERELLDRYRRKRETALADLADAQARMSKYDLAVKGLEAVLDIEAQSAKTEPVPGESEALAKPRESGVPRGERAAQLIMDEFQSLSIAELTKQMVERGAIAADAQHPESATRQAFNRLRRKKPSEYDLINGNAVKLSSVGRATEDNLIFSPDGEP